MFFVELDKSDEDFLCVCILLTTVDSLISRYEKYRSGAGKKYYINIQLIDELNTILKAKKDKSKKYKEKFRHAIAQLNQWKRTLIKKEKAYRIDIDN